ncbi:glycosyl hydrolase [Teichococcus deserti]|uniref:glycosyl hydrolase n=1 Tax=Teichococcus deserti TaxID=1817963 RepID=UPI0013F6001C|nr:glycosyl hydrolase [Pseudoroseomonas deserti]
MLLTDLRVRKGWLYSNGVFTDPVPGGTPDLPDTNPTRSSEIYSELAHQDAERSASSALVSLQYAKIGVKGDKGDTGDQGPAGPRGNIGPPGIQGIPGPQGIEGVVNAVQYENLLARLTNAEAAITALQVGLTVPKPTISNQSFSKPANLAANGTIGTLVLGGGAPTIITSSDDRVKVSLAGVLTLSAAMANPTQATVITLTITVTNGGGSNAATITVTLTAVVAKPVITANQSYTNLANVAAGAVLGTAIATTGGAPASFTSSDVRVAVSSAGVASLVTAFANVYQSVTISVNITATNAGGSDTKAVTFVFNGVAITDAARLNTLQKLDWEAYAQRDTYANTPVYGHMETIGSITYWPLIWAGMKEGTPDEWQQNDPQIALQDIYALLRANAADFAAAQFWYDVWIADVAPFVGGSSSSSNLKMVPYFENNVTAGTPPFEQFVGKQVAGTQAHTDKGDTNYTNVNWFLTDAAGGHGREVYVVFPLLPNVEGTNYSDPVNLARLATAASGGYNSQYVTAANNIISAINQNNAAGLVQQDKIDIRTGWEFNGDWMSWRAQGRQANFIAAWRNLVNAFRSVTGGNRFEFTWCGNYGQGYDPSTAYPGDAYVDKVGVNFYYYSYVGLSTDPQQAFNTIRTMDWGLDWWSGFAQSRAKPLVIPEWGAAGYGPDADSAAFITYSLDWMRANSVQYEGYWDQPGTPEEITRSDRVLAQAAYKAGHS